MWKTKKYVNKLTSSIINNKTNLEQAIFHQELSVSLRNESQVLFDFLFSPENYENLINYALFDKHAETKEFKDFAIRQINNNASHILSYPSKKMKERISKIENGNNKPLLLLKLEEFINNEKYSTDPYYAGHFERIYENILREPGSAFTIFFDDFFKQLFPFIMKNITILPYRELCKNILEDFTEEMGEENTNYILKTILQHSVYNSYILFYHSHNNANSLGVSYRKLRKDFREYRPMNKYKNEIPIPQFISNQAKDIENQYIDKAREKYNKFCPKKVVNPKKSKDNLEDISMRAYFCLSSIYQAFSNINCFRYLEDDEILEMLLFCGVFSDTESLSSMEAFRILENVYYGNPSYDIEPYQKESFLKLIDEYAEFITYGHRTLNLLDVNAFPLFWNHRYDYSSKFNKPCLIGIDPILNINKSFECDEKQTPLLILRSFLFTDPPISSRLLFSYLKIFRFLDNRRKKLTGTNIKSINQYERETREKIKTIDIIVYEFIQRPFPYYTGNKNEKYQFLNFYEALDKIIPYFPKNEKDSQKNSQIRAPLNGSAFEICRTLLHSSFFIINNEPSDLLIDIDKNFQLNNTDSNSVIDVLQHYSREINIAKQNIKLTKKTKLFEFSSDDDE